MIVAGSTEAAPQQAEADKLEQNNPMAERRASGSHPETFQPSLSVPGKPQ